MDELYDNIDRYLLGKMSSDEKSLFEKEIASDDNLGKDIEVRRLLIEGVRPYCIVKEAEESYWQDMSEVIDQYLLNQMSDSEKQSFEERLDWDTELCDHVETQRLIMLGIRLETAERTIKVVEFAEKLREQQYRGIKARARIACEASKETPAAASISTPKKRRYLKLAYGLIAAACLFLAIIPVGHFTAISYGDDAFNSIERSADSISQHVEKKEYDKAIESLKSNLDELRAQPAGTLGVATDIERTIYDLASVMLLNGDVSDAKDVLDLYQQEENASATGEKILELRKKLWWIIW